MCSSSVVRMKKSLDALEPRHQRLEALRVLIGQRLRLEALAAAASATGSPCSSVPVRKNTSVAALAHVARQHVGGDRRVGVAEVRLAR